jgi:F-type H+-transporting ATPase subunit b
MLYLIDFSPIKAEFGLVFWTVIIFLAVWFLIGKLAFKPIANALRDREKSIEDALKSAELARQEMSNLKAENENILRQAREEKAAILAEANQIKDRIIAEAKEKADADFKRKVDSAMLEIKNRENEMMVQLRNQTGKLAVEIAEKIIRKELAGNKEHEEFADRLSKDMNLN